MNIVILENIRSAYNVGNVVRTADALGQDVRITGYTPSPLEHPKVKKTSLGAEESVHLEQFNFTADAIQALKDRARTGPEKRGGYTIIAAELTPDAINLEEFSHTLKQTTTNEPSKEKKVAIVFGNEVEGVLPSTLNLVDHIVQIPMQGIKESLNIGQSAAIFMRELGKTGSKT